MHKKPWQRIRDGLDSTTTYGACSKKKNAQIYIQSSSKLKEIERDKITCLSVSFYTVKAVTDKIILKLLLWYSVWH